MKMKIILSLLLLGFFVIFTLIQIKDTRDEKSMKKDTNPKYVLEERKVDNRSIRFSADKEYVKDVNKLSYKSNNKGEFEANLQIIHDTVKEDKIIFYAILEGSGRLLEFNVNGNKGKHYIVTVPKKGEKNIKFKFEDLPSGKHVIYLFNEKYLDEVNKADEFETLNFEKYLGSYYFSMEVDNKQNKTSKTVEYNFKAIKEDKHKLDKGQHITLYNDENLKGLTESIKPGTYYLAINNSNDYEYNVNICLLVNYDSIHIEQIKIPKQAKIVVPLSVTDEIIMDKKSLKILLFGEPIGKTNEYGIPERIIISSKRLIVDHK